MQKSTASQHARSNQQEHLIRERFFHSNCQGPPEAQSGRVKVGGKNYWSLSFFCDGSYLQPFYDTFFPGLLCMVFIFCLRFKETHASSFSLGSSGFGWGHGGDRGRVNAGWMGCGQQAPRQQPAAPTWELSLTGMEN